MLDQILAPSIEVEFLVESRALARKLQAAGLPVTAGDVKRTDTYLKADISPQTCIIIEDTGRRYLPKVIEAIRDAGGSLIYVLGVGIGRRPREAGARPSATSSPTSPISPCPSCSRRRCSPSSAAR